MAPPLLREHRLYQADWLMRFYEFKVDELTAPDAPNLDLAVDPKLSWALRNRHLFPVDLNKASRQLLLRVPGLGTKSVERILKVRRWHKLRLEDLTRLHLPVAKVIPFIVVADYVTKALSLEPHELARKFAPAHRQLDLFASGISAVSGQL